MKTDHQFSTSV